MNLDKIERALTQKRRAYLYRAAVAVIVALGSFGLLAENDVATTVALVTALLGQTTATAFTRKPVRRRRTR